MKFNITVEIDWLGEDGSIDDVIKNNIVDGVVERISREAVNSIKDKALKNIENKINELVEKTYEGFLSKGVTITDEWGDVKRKNITIHDLIKEKCDKWLTAKVNNDGVESSYSAKWTRMEWLINKQLNQQTKLMSDELVKKVSEEIKKYVNDSVKSAIGEKLVEQIGLDKILSKAN